MNSNIQFLTTEVSKLTELLTAKTTEIDSLNSTVKGLEAKVNKLENLIDDEDAYVRRDSLIFSGPWVPLVENAEIPSNTVRNIIKDKLKIVLHPNDVSVAHRLGKKPTSQLPDRRPIIVKFTRRDIKRDILSARRTLKNECKDNIYINESLTPKRRTILFALRKIRKNHGDVLTGCSTIEGRVYAYTKPPGANTRARNSSDRRPDQRHVINTHESLVEFCREYIKKPLEDFLDSWGH